MLPLFICAALFVSVPSNFAVAYVVHDPEIEVLKPSGLKVSIPAEDGVELFAVHANVNREMDGLEAGDMSKDVVDKRNGKFTFYNGKANVKGGNVVYYWLYVLRSGLGYQLDNGKFVYHDDNDTKKRGICPPGYRKKTLTDRDSQQVIEPNSRPSSFDGRFNAHDQRVGSYGLGPYPGNQRDSYLHAFRPGYLRNQWYPRLVDVGRWRQHVQGSTGLLNYWQNLRSFEPNLYTPIASDTYQPGFIWGNRPAANSFNGEPHDVHEKVRRDASSEETQDGNYQLGSRYGFLRGYEPNNLGPHHYRPGHKHQRGRGHGYGYGHDHYHGRRPYGRPPPFAGGFPYESHHYPNYDYKGDHGKFNEYFDCEEDSSEEAQPMFNGGETTEIVVPTSSPPTKPITSATTTTSTEPSSTFPQIDIRFGGS